MQKKLIALFILFVVGLVFPFQSFAQGEPTPPPDSSEGLKNRFGVEIAQDEIDSYIQATSNCSTPSLECLVKNTVTFTMIELTHNILGDDCALTTSASWCSDEAADASGQRKAGFIADAYNFMGILYEQPPANTATFVSYTLNSANIATPAYAQGLGFAALDPILDLWIKFRNIAYMCFIFIFIIIGFMIMFRAKIVGQTAVTAQQAIPSVIVSLVFVTFSYAIAGFLIDIMYVFMFGMVNLFSGSVGQDAIGLSIFGLGWSLFTGGSGLAGWGNNENVISSVLESAGFNVPGVAWLGGLTITVTLAIAMLIATFKLFFELLKSYASVVLNVVIAPLILMVGAIPGKSVVKPWIMGIVGNLAAFPTVLLMLIIFKEFSQPVSNEAGGGFVPPFLINLGIPGIIGHIMGLAIILALPEVVAKVKKLLGATEGFGFDLAKTAWDRTKSAWNKPGVPLLPSAQTALGAASAIPLGGLAGLGYGAYNKAKGGSFKEGFGKGFVGGGLTGLLAPRIPGFTKKVFETGVSQTGQALANYAIGDQLQKFNNKDTKEKTDKMDEGMESYKPPKPTAGQTTTDLPTNVTQSAKPDMKGSFGK